MRPSRGAARMGGVRERPARRRVPGGAAAVMLKVAPGLILALTVVACGSGHHLASGPTSTAPAPAPTATTPAPAPAPTAPPPTSWTPSAPQPDPEAAAAQLVTAWASDNRAGAAGVAAPGAVSTLFGAPYPGPSRAVARGCSSAFPPSCAPMDLRAGRRPRTPSTSSKCPGMPRAGTSARSGSWVE